MNPTTRTTDAEPIAGLSLRMLDKNVQPSLDAVREWIGSKNFSYWTRVLEFIEGNYPGVFSPDWQFGGKKHGWSLRFKKSKSFCTLIPERERLVIQIVLGRREREETETILPELSAHIREQYANATTYHDGKWLGIVVDHDEILDDVERLLLMKRKPRIVRISSR